MVNSELAAFIITYNRPDKLHQTLAQLSLQTVAPSKILIVNNGNEFDAGLGLTLSGVEVEQYAMGYNSGPAGAANFALNHLSSQGFKWIQWIDDDDPPRLNNLNERLFEHLKKLKDQNIGIIAPVGSYFDVKTGTAIRVRNAEIENNSYLAVQTVGGNQCMLINSEVVRAKCLPTAALFFGFEETNFCLKVLNAGFKIVVPCDLFFEYRNLSGRWNLTTTKNSQTIPVWRNYYSIRNLIYMFLYEFNRPSAAAMVIGRATIKPLYSFLQLKFGKGMREAYYSFLAIKDGVFKIIGLTVKPEAKK